MTNTIETIESTQLQSITGGAARKASQTDPWASLPGMVKTGPHSYRYVGSGGATAFQSRGENLRDAAGIALFGAQVTLGALFGL